MRNEGSAFFCANYKCFKHRSKCVNQLGISGSMVSHFPTRKVIQQSFKGNIAEHNVP